MGFQGNNAAAQFATVKTLAADKAAARVKQGELTLLDVREHGELAMSGKAAGAVHIPLVQLQMKADPRSPEFHADLSTDKPVAIYCQSGGRAHVAGQALLAMGFGEVYNIGGLAHWQAGGGAVEAV